MQRMYVTPTELVKRKLKLLGCTMDQIERHVRAMTQAEITRRTRKWEAEVKRRTDAMMTHRVESMEKQLKSNNQPSLPEDKEGETQNQKYKGKSTGGNRQGYGHLAGKEIEGSNTRSAMHIPNLVMGRF